MRQLKLRYSAAHIVVALAVCAFPQSARSIEDPEYARFIEAPSRYSTDFAFRAYLLGIAAAVRMDYNCGSEDWKILGDPDRLLTELTSFSGTLFGRLYIEGQPGVFGGVSRISTGQVLLNILLFTIVVFSSPRRRSNCTHRARPNPSVKASPNSCACKPRMGQNVHRPLRGLHAPL
jgi:hypothetical protein